MLLSIFNLRLENECKYGFSPVHTVEFSQNLGIQENTGPSARPLT